MNQAMADSTESTLATSLRLTKALSLARQGKLKPAQLLLAPENGVPPTSTTELHALAALVTHEGDYPRALRLWRLLQQRQPDHPEARRMIPMIEVWMSRPSWYRFMPWIAATAGVGVCVLLLWVFGAFRSQPAAPKPIYYAPPARVTPAPTPAPASVPITPIRPPPVKNQRTR
jgi:hypothetical protein